MKSLIFAKRNIKELLRDPLSLIFGVGLPVLLLIIIGTLQKSISVDIFNITSFAPGIAIFSFSFITLFTAMLVSKDRTSSFLTRLFASPMKSSDFILGYTIPLVPISIIQSIICFIFSLFFGLTFNINIIYCILVLIPVSFLFIALGLLLGSLFSDSQAPGVTSILIQIVALSSGMWFDLSLVGGVIKTICECLPFSHALNLVRGILLGSYTNLWIDALWVFGYTVVVIILSVIIFKKKMQK